MKFSVIVALSIAALASAQVPKGTAPKGIPKGAGGAKGMGGQCAASCFAAPLQNGGCKLTGLFPKGAGGAGAMGKPPGGKPPGGKPAGGMAGMAGMSMHRRQDAPKPTGAPKFSISPEQQAAIASARSCFCAAPALKDAGGCVASACATAADGGAGAVKMMNGICKGVSGYTPLTAAPPAPAAAATPA